MLQVMVEILDNVGFYTNPKQSTSEISKFLISMLTLASKLGRLCRCKSPRAWTAVMYTWTVSLLQEKNIKAVLAATNVRTKMRYKNFVQQNSKKLARVEARERIIHSMYMSHQVFCTAVVSDHSKLTTVFAINIGKQ